MALRPDGAIHIIHVWTADSWTGEAVTSKVSELSRCTRGTRWRQCVAAAASVGRGEYISIIYLSNIFWIKYRSKIASTSLFYKRNVGDICLGVRDAHVLNTTPQLYELFTINRFTQKINQYPFLRPDLCFSTSLRWTIALLWSALRRKMSPIQWPQTRNKWKRCFNEFYILIHFYFEHFGQVE